VTALRTELSLARLPTGDGDPVVIIAEIGVNHNGSVELGLDHVRAAADAGAGAVKFQTFKSTEVVTTWAPSAPYQRDALGVGSQLEMIRNLELSETDLAVLMKESRRLGLVAFSSPFDLDSVEILLRVGVEWMKVASGELTNHELIAEIGATGLPTFISTGMATLPEIEASLNLYEQSGGGPVVLLHCVSSYPAPLDQMNLRAIETLRRTFGVPVGLSDHTIGRDAAVAAVTLGARAIEKHMTVNRQLRGPDHAMSMEPAELAGMVSTIRQLERGGLGTGSKILASVEIPIQSLARRSIVTREAIPAGTKITRAMLAVKRPAGGLGPERLADVVGRRARRDLGFEERITLDDLD